MDVSSLMATVGTVALLGVAGAVMLVARQRRQARDTAAWTHTVERGQHIPPSLHPVIDPDICIGSLSCLKACPEGDILGIVDGVATLVDARPLHRPRPVRGRVPGGRHQAGVRHQ